MGKEIDRVLKKPIWERQSFETDHQWRAFCIYRNLGFQRSLDKALQEANKKSTTKGAWGSWSSKNQWVKRVSAYDDYIEGKVRKDAESEIFKMNKRHISSMVYIQNRMFVEKLMEMTKKDMRDLKVVDAVTILEKTMKMERLGRGVSTESTDHNVNGDMVISMKRIVEKYKERIAQAENE